MLTCTVYTHILLRWPHTESLYQAIYCQVQQTDHKVTTAKSNYMQLSSVSHTKEKSFIWQGRREYWKKKEGILPFSYDFLSGGALYEGLCVVRVCGLCVHISLTKIWLFLQYKFKTMEG